MLNRFVPEKVKTFDKKNFISIAGGQHHTVALDADGKILKIRISQCLVVNITVLIRLGTMADPAIIVHSSNNSL